MLAAGFDLADSQHLTSAKKLDGALCQQSPSALMISLETADVCVRPERLLRSPGRGVDYLFLAPFFAPPFFAPPFEPPLEPPLEPPFLEPPAFFVAISLRCSFSELVLVTTTRYCVDISLVA
jgi:hypothetical protein